MCTIKITELIKNRIVYFDGGTGTILQERGLKPGESCEIWNITRPEEIIRLHSHLKAMRDEINSNPIPGKKLDFICQEANREINTIGSKNQFTEVGARVIAAKDALENIREQSKNVE